MQTITEQQTKTIAKEIVKLSNKNTLLKHSAVLEIISKSLGYKDYNALSSVFKKESLKNPTNKKDKDLSKTSNMDKILTTINDIKYKLKTEAETLSNKEIQSLNQELKTQRLNYTKASNKYEQSKVKIEKKMKEKKLLEGSACPNCNGKGSKDIAVSTDVNNMMWYDDGEFFTLTHEECVLCSGTGRITNQGLEKVQKMKIES